MPNLVVHPGCDVAADTQAHVLLVRVMHLGEHRETLSLGVHAQRDHAALAHTVDVPGRTLDILGIQIRPGKHDEILRSAAHVNPPLLIEVTEVAGVEPAVPAGYWNGPV